MSPLEQRVECPNAVEHVGLPGILFQGDVAKPGPSSIDQQRIAGNFKLLLPERIRQDERRCSPDLLPIRHVLPLVRVNTLLGDPVGDSHGGGQRFRVGPV